MKTIGDEVMIAADAPAEALRVALALRSLVEQEPFFPALRAGIHRGPCIRRDDGDYFGATVNIAARVAGYARSGELLCTEEVAQSIRGFPEVELRSAGSGKFKNVSAPVALWEVVNPELPIVSGFVDPVCRMRVVPTPTALRLSLEGAEHFFCSLQCLRAFVADPDRHRPR